MTTIKNNEKRVIFHYLACLVLISIYGVQVCPFVEGLTTIQFAVPLALIIGVQYILHLVFTRRIVTDTRLELLVSKTLALELKLFLMSGLILAIFNTIAYDFPIISGLKMVLGFVTLGIFSAIDLALKQERELHHYIREQGIHLVPKEQYFPVASKFSLFAASSILLMVSVIFLLIIKDIDWLTQIGNEITLAEAKISIFKEFAFIGAVLLAYILNVIHSYAANLKLFFDNENHVLAKATRGDLSGVVTVSGNDEFGLMAQHTNLMIKTLKKRNHDLQLTQDVTILTLASLAEARDNETGAHILRTQRYVKALAEKLREHPKYTSELDDASIELLYKSAPLHDIGKVGIPDSILLKPGKLSEEEFTIMKTHAELGGEALRVAETKLGSSSFLKFAREIALSHHEKWNGKGYPNGLQGDEIPLSGRLMAVADVYDALISKRVYKPAFSHQKAVDLIKKGRGEHFDPDIVDAMLAVETQFIQIAAAFNQEDKRHQEA